MDIVELMHALENAFTHAYPGREAADRNDVMHALQRLLDARADPLAPAPRLAIHCGVRAVLLS